MTARACIVSTKYALFPDAQLLPRAADPAGDSEHGGDRRDYDRTVDSSYPSESHGRRGAGQSEAAGRLGLHSVSGTHWQTAETPPAGPGTRAGSGIESDKKNVADSMMEPDWKVRRAGEKNQMMEYILNIGGEQQVC